MVPHDVKLGYMGTPVPCDPLGYEGERIAKLVAHWEGKKQALLLTEAVEHVENGAAGCLVGLQEHDVCLGPARAKRRPLSCLRKREQRPRPLRLHPTNSIRDKQRQRDVSSQILDNKR